MVWFSKLTLSKDSLKSAEKIKTKHFEVHKIEDTYVIMWIPTLPIFGTTGNYEGFRESMENGDNPFDILFNELKIKDHSSVIIDQIEIFLMLSNSMKILKSLKFSKILMPIYWFFNKEKLKSINLKQLLKFSGSLVRLENSLTTDSSQRELIYVWIKKSEARLEEDKFILETDLQTFASKVSKFDKNNESHSILVPSKSAVKAKAEEEKSLPSKPAPQLNPESTFSLGVANQAEKAARDNVELPYFIGENDPHVDKSKLFVVDDSDRAELYHEEMQDMELEDDEVDY